MLEYLKQWNYSASELKRIQSTVQSGRTVRTTNRSDIECIYPSSDGYTVVEIDGNGRTKEKEFETL